MSSSEAPSAHAHRPLHAVSQWGSRPGVVLLPRCYYSHVSSHRTEAQRGLCGARPPARSEASLLLGGSGLRLQNVRALAPRAHGAGASPGSRGFAGVRRALGLGRALHPRVGDAARRADTQEKAQGPRRPRRERAVHTAGDAGGPGTRGNGGGGLGRILPQSSRGRRPRPVWPLGPCTISFWGFRAPVCVNLL